VRSRFFRLFGLFLGRRDLDFGFLQHLSIELEQLERARRCHAVAAAESIGDLRETGVADADRDFAKMRFVVLVDEDGERAARRLVMTATCGTTSAFGTVRATISTLILEPGRSLPSLLSASTQTSTVVFAASSAGLTTVIFA